MSSNVPDYESSAHLAEKPRSQSVLTPVCNIVLASPNKDLATSASLKGDCPQMQPRDDTTEEKLPIFQQASEGVVEGREPSPSQVTAISDSVLSLASSAKNVVASRCVQSADVTQMAVQSGSDMTKSKFAINTETFLNDSFDQMTLESTDNMLKQSEEADDDHLPMTEDELTEIALSPERLKIPLLQQQRKRQRYFVCLGSLPTNLHQQAVQYTLDKLKQIKESALEAHLQLSQIISIINTVKKSGAPLGKSQEELHQIWYRMVPGNKDLDAEQIEARSLNLFRNVLQQLLDIFSLLSSNIQGFNDEMERKVKRSLRCVGDLKATLDKLHSFQDLFCSFMTQVQEESKNILEFLDGILDCLAEDRPLTWILGPFVPSSHSFQRAEKASEKMKED